MHGSTAMLRWGWLLGFALLAPAALPAGGSERRQPQVRRRESGGPLHTTTRGVLRSSPLAVAPALNELSIGTPCRLLHRWPGDDGRDWLHVQVLNGEQQRGWVRI